MLIVAYTLASYSPHSLGVMYIIDRMEQTLGLSLKERKKLRLAAILHDNGGWDPVLSLHKP